MHQTRLQNQVGWYNKAMAPQIVFEDEYLLVVGKPAGWITNDASTTGSQAVLQTWIHENYAFETTKDRALRDGVVHRLDKETSGILLIAKTVDMFAKLQALFKDRQITKSYEVLVHGKLDPKAGEISAPVGRLPWRRDRFGVLPGGREATTDYKVEDYYSGYGNEYSLVEVLPKTGRTHQIRIHMKHLGHAVVADEFYAGRKTARADRKWCPRLFLHAKSIAFVHPATSHPVKFEAVLPEDLQTALATLTKHP